MIKLKGRKDYINNIFNLVKVCVVLIFIRYRVEYNFCVVYGFLID